MTGPANAIRRVMTALAEWANETRVNGLSTWDASDFGLDAEKFVMTLTWSVVLFEGTDPSPETYQKDLEDNLAWSIDERYHASAIRACLFEIGPDYTGLEFE